MTDLNPRDLLFMWDGGVGVAVGIYRDGERGAMVKIGVDQDSFWCSPQAIFDMMRYYHAAGFKLESPTPDMIDAQRYRFLRDKAMTLDDAPSVVCGASGEFDFLQGIAVDEAVDEAMVASL